jgi:hypothetical protein
LSGMFSNSSALVTFGFGPGLVMASWYLLCHRNSFDARTLGVLIQMGLRNTAPDAPPITRHTTEDGMGRRYAFYRCEGCSLEWTYDTGLRSCPECSP